jgi:hypothetical protein
LGILENVEKVIANSNAKEKATKESAEKATRKRNKGKRKGNNSHKNQIPKKARVKKSCALCQKYGGAHMTHNTGECRKYNKDGTYKRVSAGKQPLDRSAMAAVRKKLLIPLRKSWNAS